MSRTFLYPTLSDNRDHATYHISIPMRRFPADWTPKRMR